MIQRHSHDDHAALVTVTTKIVGSGTIDGTNANDLILGSAGADTINGGPGLTASWAAAATIR